MTPSFASSMIVLQEAPERSSDRILDRFMEWAFQEVPQAVQIAGGPIALIVVGALVALVVWKRAALLGWWGARGRAFKTALLAAVGVVGIVSAAAGWWVYDYVQRDNEFCNSCHVMHEPFERFAESEHAGLQCHDCHQQSMLASLNQLHMWVTNRPDEVGDHAPVPTGVCADCHIAADPDSTWPQIAATVGHRVHLEADTSALADIQCVTCHGVDVHSFAPADETCGQSNCHADDKTQVVLGEMGGQTTLHCVTCHEFTAPVAVDVPVDTTRLALVPNVDQCLGCHEMTKLIRGFQPGVDPHDAVCGTCHNAHTQETPEMAAAMCRQCHAEEDMDTAFHRGLPATVTEDCVGCHEEHTFVADGSDCLACHADILGGAPRAQAARPPARPETASTIEAPIVLAGHGRDGTSTSVMEAVIRRLAERRVGEGLQQIQRFDHLAHRDLECTDCHSMEGSHGAVTIRSRRQCNECHHSGRRLAAGCESCHTTGEMGGPKPVEMRMRLSVWPAERARRVGFDHAEHGDLACSSCHASGVEQAPTAACDDCHAEHHRVENDCTTCHLQPPQTAHTVEIHARGCAGSGCHETSTYAAVPETRSSCLVCHQDLRDHKPGRVCASCHKVAGFGALGRASGR